MKQSAPFPRLKRMNQKANFTRSDIGRTLLSGLLILSVLLLIALRLTRSRKKMITRLYNYFVNVKGLAPEQARTLICQSAHETDFWRSTVFEHSNNCYGIKGHKRKVTGKLETLYKGYATYTNIEGSCNDIIDLLRRRYNIEAAHNIYLYVGALKEKGYFEDTLKNYLNGVLHAYKKIFPESWHKYNTGGNE